MNKKRWAWVVGIALGIVAGFYALWYFQSPVGAGVYPGRVGGVQFLDSTTYKLPVVWVRRFPWERFAPSMAEAQLLDEHGQVVGRSIFASPTGQELPLLGPVWLQRRAVIGEIGLPFPAEGVKATAVVFIWADGRTETYEIGPVRLHYTAGPSYASSQMNQFGQYDAEADQLEGDYLWPVGPGTLVDVISSVPGMEGTPPGLLYREDKDPDRHFNQAPYKESGAYRPLILPMEVKSYITIYLPYTEATKARLRDTHVTTRHALVYRTAEGEDVTVVPSGYYGTGVDRSRWRSWVPYFTYEPREHD